MPAVVVATVLNDRPVKAVEISNLYHLVNVSIENYDYLVIFCYHRKRLPPIQSLAMMKPIDAFESFLVRSICLRCACTVNVRFRRNRHADAMPANFNLCSAMGKLKLNIKIRTRSFGGCATAF